MKKTFVIIAILSVFLYSAADVSADLVVAESSANLVDNREKVIPDQREIKIKYYLNKHYSPLAQYSDYIIQISDKYNLDWRLITAISGVESTFGKNIPANSYNAFGWNNGNFRFNSWENSIDTVAKTLRDKYIDRGYVDLDSIGRIYAPPSNTWSRNVKYFMNKIEPYPLDYSL